MLLLLLLAPLRGAKRHRRHRSAPQAKPSALETPDPTPVTPTESDPPTIPEDPNVYGDDARSEVHDFEEPRAIEYTAEEELEEANDFEFYKAYVIHHISPPYVGTNSLKRKVLVHVEPGNIGAQEQLYARFGSEIVSCATKNASVVKCHPPVRDAGKVMIAISGDRVHWSEPFPLYYLDGWFFEVRELVMYAAVLFVVVCVALWVVYTCCGRPRRSRKKEELFQFDLSDDE